MEIHLDDPLARPQVEIGGKVLTGQTRLDFALQQPMPKLVVAIPPELERALDRPINPQLRLLLIRWMEQPEQAWLKSANRENLTFALRNQARAFNETRLPRRLPQSKLNSIADSIAVAKQNGKLGLMKRKHEKEDVLRYRDPEAYRREQQKASRRAAQARRQKALPKWRRIMQDVRAGEKTRAAIAKAHGISERHLYRIIRNMSPGKGQ